MTADDVFKYMTSVGIAITGFIAIYGYWNQRKTDAELKQEKKVREAEKQTERDTKDEGWKILLEQHQKSGDSLINQLQTTANYNSEQYTILQRQYAQLREDHSACEKDRQENKKQIDYLKEHVSKLETKLGINGK